MAAATALHLSMKLRTKKAVEQMALVLLPVLSQSPVPSVAAQGGTLSRHGG